MPLIIPTRFYQSRATFDPASGGGGGTQVIFLTSGTSWTVPADWNNANNSIETIGSPQGPRAEYAYQSADGKRRVRLLIVPVDTVERSATFVRPLLYDGFALPFADRSFDVTGPERCSKRDR